MQVIIAGLDRSTTRLGNHRMSSYSYCLVCDSPQLQHLYVAKSYEIVRCEKCSFCQVLHPPVDAELEILYANLHDNHNKFRDEQAAQRENQTRLHLIQEFVGENSVILDAGCATGDFLAHAKESYSVYGLDISAGAIEQAKSRLPELSGRLRSLKLENIGDDWPAFDAICLWDVIEHVRDPVNVCRTLIKLLKPGGYLFLSTPDMDAITARVMKKNWAFMIPPLHLGYFSAKSFKYLFLHKVPARILACRNRGKWTNLAFIFYKLNQISKWLAPPVLLEWLSTSRPGRLNLYVPTNDIIYLVIQKQDQKG
jgi:2-polyprenyl-3-methyl-5-hydroxy-6-metoxy-1,4-benzoquinol methylase